MNIVPKTLRTLVVAFQESSPVGVAAGPTRHEYEEDAVSSKTGTLLLRTPSLSQVGGVPERAPLALEQSSVGPGIEFVYQAETSADGAAITGTVLSTPTTYEGPSFFE
jgi:hypothetical protein